MLLVCVCFVYVCATFTFLIIMLLRFSLKAQKLAKNVRKVNFQYRLGKITWRVLRFRYFAVTVQCFVMKQQKSSDCSYQLRFLTAKKDKNCSKTVFFGLRARVPGFKKVRGGNCRSFQKAFNISSILEWFSFLMGSCYIFLGSKTVKKQ